MAIADRNYFDWAELPEAPSELGAARKSSDVELNWKMHEGNPTFVSVERRDGRTEPWHLVSKLPGNATSYSDGTAISGGKVSYRVRAGNSSGGSAYSNVATLTQ